jgi:hypothetical protein
MQEGEGWKEWRGGVQAIKSQASWEELAHYQHQIVGLFTNRRKVKNSQSEGQ